LLWSVTKTATDIKPGNVSSNCKKMIVQQISSSQKEQLFQISFSQDKSIKYYPCKVKLLNGEEIENVYIVEEKSYMKVWGVMPDADKGKKFVLIENIFEIQESPNRLKPNLANKIYQAGESGMGYCLFKIIFKNGEQLDVASGNAVDFVPLPVGQFENDIVDVLPHQGSRINYVESPDFYWCLYKK